MGIAKDKILLRASADQRRHAMNVVKTALDKCINLLDFAPIGIFTLSPEGAVRTANLHGINLLGVEHFRLIGRRFEDFVTFDTQPFFSEFLGKVFAQQGKESCEVKLMREGTHAIFVQFEAVADVSGEECTLAVIDITERRNAEAVLAKNRQEIEEINRTLEVRIVKDVEEIRQKDEMLILQDRLSVMGEMINNIAHQWKQPLNTLGLVVQELPICYDSGKFSREVLKENTKKAMDLIQHMSQTIEDFRSLFKIDKEAITFSVNDVVTRTLCFIEKTFKDQNISIVFHPEGDQMATGFPNEYSQVLLNILLNARDALVEHKVDDALISIHAFAEGGRSVVTITDNAGGIAEEIIGKLFDAYFTTKAPDKGTGIGLYMSKTIIEKNMRGRLTVRNRGGGGGGIQDRGLEWAFILSEQGAAWGSGLDIARTMPVPCLFPHITLR